MPRSRITGTGFAVPDRVVRNDDLAQLMDTSDEWIRVRTGIQERRWAAEGETGFALAHEATLKALDMAGRTARDIEAIVYATSTPDHFIPGGGVFLQRLLGIPTIPALDIRVQCSGFVYGLSVGDAWIRAGEYQRVLVVGAEIQSTGMDVSTRGRNTAVIFADGAGAAILEPAERPGARFPGVRSPGGWQLCRGALGRRPGFEVSPAGVGRAPAGREVLSPDGRQGGFSPCRHPDAGVSPHGSPKGRTRHERRLPADPAPGESPDLRGRTEGIGTPGGPGLQQHHALWQYQRLPRSPSAWTSASEPAGWPRETSSS